MQFILNCSLIILLSISLITGENHTVCEICTCDNLDQPITVNCDSKELSDLTNIIFPSTIETLSLMNNLLTFKSVDDLIKINNITSLKSLILLNNPLANIPEISSSHLITLQLKNTFLKSARFPKSYENCTNLQSIELSNNRLTKILSDDFESLSTLTKLSIDNAELHSIEQNSFTSLSKNLHSLSLISNSLQSAEFLSTLPYLRSINLDKNQFEQLPIEMMKPDQIEHFFFRDNQIKIIDELSPLYYWMKTNLSNIEIYLQNNPFDCCQSRWFIRYLAGSNNLVKDSSNLTCTLPNIYKGKRLIDLHADLMECSHRPIDPSKSHLSSVVIVLLCIIGIVILILVVFGKTLYKRYELRLLNRRQPRTRDYESIQGENFPG